MPPKVKKKVQPQVEVPEPIAEAPEPEPEIKFEPEEGDGIPIGPGEVDEMGNFYLEELDFLKLQARKERKKACVAQAEALRSKVELIQLKMREEANRFANQAAAYERAAKVHEGSIQDQLTELSKKYDIDFKDPTVVVDEEQGKIVATDPTKGLPRLSNPGG